MKLDPWLLMEQDARTGQLAKALREQHSALAINSRSATEQSYVRMLTVVWLVRYMTICSVHNQAVPASLPHGQ